MKGLLQGVGEQSAKGGGRDDDCAMRSINEGITPSDAECAAGEQDQACLQTAARSAARASMVVSKWSQTTGTGRHRPGAPDVKKTHMVTQAT